MSGALQVFPDGVDVNAPAPTNADVGKFSPVLVDPIRRHAEALA